MSRWPEAWPGILPASYLVERRQQGLGQRRRGGGAWVDAVAHQARHALEEPAKLLDVFEHSIENLEGTRSGRHRRRQQ